MPGSIPALRRPIGFARAPVIVPLLSRAVKATPLFLQQAGMTMMKHGKDGGGGAIEPADPPDSPAFFLKLVVSVALVLAGGVFAGLTLALMGSDEMHLRVLAMSSDEESERKNAARVLRLLHRGRHWVLVVLLLGNVIVNESLPIFLNDVFGGGLAAVVVSTTMIVIFGEIIPQSVCVRYGLSIGGFCAPMVLGLMWLFAPVAYPTAKLLDWALGSEEGHTFRKAELKTFLQFHKEGEEPLRDDEITILNGVLSLNDKKAQEIMTPIDDVLCLPADKVLDHATIDAILLSGFSRIPIYEPNQRLNFVGMLLVKRLISYNPEDCKKVSEFSLLSLPEALPDINCFQALDYFQTGRAHLLLISEKPGHAGGALGIVSLEDLIEEIIGEEIVDETDRFVDNHSKLRAKRQSTANVMRGIIERHRKGVNPPSRSMTNSPGIGATSATGTGTIPSTLLDGALVQIDGDPYKLTHVEDPRALPSAQQDLLATPNVLRAPVAQRMNTAASRSSSCRVHEASETLVELGTHQQKALGKSPKEQENKKDERKKESKRDHSDDEDDEEENGEGKRQQRDGESM